MHHNLMKTHHVVEVCPPVGWNGLRLVTHLPRNQGSLIGNVREIAIRTMKTLKCQSWFILWSSLHMIQVYSSFLHLYPAHPGHCIRQAKAEKDSFQIINQIDFISRKIKTCIFLDQSSLQKGALILCQKSNMLDAELKQHPGMWPRIYSDSTALKTVKNWTETDMRAHLEEDKMFSCVFQLPAAQQGETSGNLV